MEPVSLPATVAWFPKRRLATVWPAVKFAVNVPGAAGAVCVNPFGTTSDTV